MGSGDIRVEIGFIATRMTSGSPVVMPPSRPPALLLRRRKPARGSPPAGGGALDGRHRSDRAPRSPAAAPPRRRGRSRPPSPPGSTSACPARRPSSFRSQLTWLPSPTTTPRATTSTSPPSVSPAFFAASIRRDDLGLDARGRARGPRSGRPRSLSGTGSSARRRRRDAAERDDVAPDLHPELVEQPPGQRAGRHARGGLAGAGALEDVAGVDPIVLEHADQVGVAGPRARDAPAAELARLGGLVAPSRPPSWPSRGWGSAWRRASPASRRRGRRTATRSGRARSSSARRGRSPASGGARSRSTHSALTGSPAGSPSTRATRALPWDSPAVENRRCTRSSRLGARRVGRNERARPAPGSFPSGCSDGAARAATDPRRRRR